MGSLFIELFPLDQALTRGQARNEASVREAEQEIVAQHIDGIKVETTLTATQCALWVKGTPDGIGALKEFLDQRGTPYQEYGDGVPPTKD
jgi:hypothetical protein